MLSNGILLPVLAPYNTQQAPCKPTLPWLRARWVVELLKATVQLCHCWHYLLTYHATHTITCVFRQLMDHLLPPAAVVAREEQEIPCFSFHKSPGQATQRKLPHVIVVGDALGPQKALQLSIQLWLVATCHFRHTIRVGLLASNNPPVYLNNQPASPCNSIAIAGCWVVDVHR